jgi:hypothetical protein
LLAAPIGCARPAQVRLIPACSLAENGKIRQIPAIRTEIGRSRLTKF